MSIPVVQLAEFLGRFGNQFIQYACARSFADKFGAVLETPQWIGERIFQGVEVRRWTCAPVWADREEIPPYPNVVLHGYFQHQRAYDLMSRAKLRTWFTVRPELLALCSKPRPFYIACHLRYEDYLAYPQLATINRECYRRAVRDYGYSESDIVWVSSDAPTINTSLPPELDFLHDFLILMQADVIFRANSTFSQAAAMISHASVFSPQVTGKRGPRDDVEFERGNHCRNMDPDPPPAKEVHTTCYIAE